MGVSLEKKTQIYSDIMITWICVYTIPVPKMLVICYINFNSILISL